MSGPALKQLHAHHAIHQGTFTEAEEIMEIIRQLCLQGSTDRALELSHILMEHWETRTLAHAEAEEEGFYLEKIQENPELTTLITKFKRDHELVKILVNETKELLQQREINQAILTRLEAILAIVEIHSREEEMYLLS
ncbi:hemerythrin domain-containing protein [Fodinisporobacter ferrooxydans]|uniref:Hemerythrin domain-containing protein n=1 Tax=Fodinisporobacter ferrooxydans TaxID=2901836 RepID=A0ABY4CMY8_9BACL|nr:hemerythrin domain-containing protein [Alicyclobacillaceae bacterium MYW30-H2]